MSAQKRNQSQPLPLVPGSSTKDATIKSKYWCEDSDHDANSPFPRPKRHCSKLSTPLVHRSAPRSLTAPAATASKQPPKRKFEDAFDFRLEASVKDVAKVKQEPQDDNNATKSGRLTHHFAASKPGQSTFAPKAATPASVPKESARPSDSSSSEQREQSIIVAALAEVWDSAVTEANVALVVRWARNHATSGHVDVYDTAFIQNILADLDTYGVDTFRRTVVTELLARLLRQRLESLRSSSESLQSRLTSITTPQPSSPLSRNSKQRDDV